MTTITEANRIKDALRACTTAAEVERVAAEHRDTVMGWRDQPGDAGVMFAHIVNLKKQMLAGLKADKGRAA